jgi:O-antigen ligase
MNKHLTLINITTASLFMLALGILTSVTLLSIYQLLFLIPLIYYSYQVVQQKNYQLPKSAWWLLAFILVGILSIVFNLSNIPAPGKSFGKLKYFVYGLAGIFVLRNWLSTASDRSKRLLANTFLISILIAAAAAGWSVFGAGLDRARGLTHTMRYGYGSAMILLILLSCLLHRKKIKAWFDARLGLIAFILGFVGMYITYTRGALLGFICGLPLVIYFYRKQWGYIVGALALAGALTLGGFYLFGSGQYESRFLVSKNNASDYIRRNLWRSAWIATQEKPLLGHGIGNFHSQLMRIKTAHQLDTMGLDDTHAHNLYLETSAGTGLVGLILFLGWIISWGLELLKRPGVMRAALIPMGAAWLISSCFEVTLDANNASMILFLYALSIASDGSRTESKPL